ncbi:MAG: DNA polymerase III subunit alpha [Parvibaculaceae bacterium]
MSDSAPRSAPFVHLRVHSSYSLSEGALPVKQLAKLAHDMNMPALSITDTNNLFGALEFSETLAEKGIQPIIGCTLKINFADDGRDQTGRPGTPPKFPAVALLAKDETGYSNLMRLTSRAWLDHGATSEPHIDLALLGAGGGGLICLTGGPDGPVDMALAEGQPARARQRLEALLALFGDRLYVELQRHGTEAEKLAEPMLVDFAYELGIPLVATNQPFFAARGDFAAHDALLCIADGEVVANDKRRRLTPEHYFKSPAEMAELFSDLPEALDNTAEIARRSAFRPVPRKPILPRFAAGDEGEELRRQASEGLAARIAARGVAPGFTEEQYRERLDFELGVIIRMMYSGYFLIVADFIKYARSRDIPVGPGRGSGAGSLVAYSLTITDLDPLRFDLLFERFLNPDRVSMPDFDIDFCQDRRDEVISYVQEKYGADRVAQIITFGKLQARAVCRDVGRVLQMPYGQVDRLCKLIPMNPANPVSLRQAIEGEPRLQEERDKDETVRTMLEIGLKLEGLYRHASTHAAGVVIGDRPLEELVPLYRDPRSSMPATQFNLKWVEPAGLVKFDFLGLKTLTVIDKAQKLIRMREPEFDASAIPLDDGKSFEMLARGETVGVFQMESAGMRDAVKQMHADRLEDLIALVALYRPGPMANIPVYCARKLGREEIGYFHPKLEPILKETFGVITYQEQVQQIGKDLAGYTLAEADLLRRAMGKKIKAEMDAQRSRFLNGAVERGIDEATATLIFDACAKFAEYGFNKSHSAPYAYLSYQTAYLKANYPVEFLAASMTLDMGNTDKLRVFKREAQRMGVKVEPPDVNASGVEFQVENGAIRYALAALKNVGRQAVEHVMEARGERRFRSLGDFARRVDSHYVNRRALESMAKAGAFDSLNQNRAQLVAGLDAVLNMANRTTAEASLGQNDLFGGGGETVEDVALPVAEPWLPMEKLAAELEATGFYLSGHPLDDYMGRLSKIGVKTWAQFQDEAARGATAARLAGTVTHRQERRSKSGNRFAFVGLSDPTGQYETICFSDTLAAARDLLDPGKAVIARVEADVDGESIRLRLQGVEPLDAVAATVATGLTIYLKDAQPVSSIAQRLTNGGRAPVRVVLDLDAAREVEIVLGTRFTVTPGIKAAIKAIPGVVDVVDL